jgi:RNA polymerase sigma factor (sigma-70 family)
MYDDLLGEAALRFVEICDKFDPKRDVKFTTFLHSQLFFYLQNAITKEVRTQMAEEMFVVMNDYDNSYDPNKFEELLRSAALTPNQRDVLRLRYIVGMTYQEIADELGISKPAAFKTEQRAVDTLKRELDSQN